MTTLTIMRILPVEIDPLVYNMSIEDCGEASFAGIGGLSEQVRELKEVIELPLMNPDIFARVGTKPPKGVLLYGPPGTGKTLLARAVAKTLDCNFLKVVSSAIVDKYIGESARLIREMFGTWSCFHRNISFNIDFSFRKKDMRESMSRVLYSWMKLTR